MNIRAKVLAALLGSTIFAGAALAAQTSNMPLADAAKIGNVAAVRALLNSPAKEGIAGPDGTAALVWAADRNDLELADLLLHAGANAKAANEFGATPLYAAAANPNPAMTEKLLAAGADPNTPLALGETPLIEAARQGNLAAVQALLKGGANPSAQAGNGKQTALMWAISQHHSAITKALVEGGADVQARSKNGFTALMFAAQQGDANSTRILLAAGADPNDVMPKTRFTPLLIASAMDRPEVVALLLEHKADPNASDVKGLTPLHRAVRDSDRGSDPSTKIAAVAVVKELLAHGANPNVRVQPDKNVSDDYERDLPPEERDRASLTVNGVSLRGATPLALAAEVNNLEAVKVLVEAGADPVIPTDRKMTALMLAAGGASDVLRQRAPDERATAVETARFLVEHGADVNGVGQFGWTPLHCAAYQGLNDVIEFLVSKGAKLDVQDEFGQTPLSISLSVLTKGIGKDRRLQIPRLYRRQTAELLLKLGATPLDRSGVEVVLQRTGDLVAEGQADAE